jgi:hypothetical protein
LAADAALRDRLDALTRAAMTIKYSATTSPLVARQGQNPRHDGHDQWRTAALQPPPFEYLRPKVLKEALEITAEDGDQAEPRRRPELDSTPRYANVFGRATSS